MNQEKKDNKVKYFIIFIGVCVLATCGLAIYYMFFMNRTEEKELPKTSPKPTVTEEKEEKDVGTPIDINNEVVTSFMKTFQILDEHTVSKYYFHKGLSYNRNSVPNDVKISLAILSLSKEGKYPLEGLRRTFKISGSEIKQKVQKIFGEDVSFQHQTVGNNSGCDFDSLTYDMNSDSYTLKESGGCGGTLIPYIISRVTSATEYKNHLEIVEKAGFVEPLSLPNGDIAFNLYNNASKEKTIVSKESSNEVDAKAIDNSIYNKYQNQFDTYVYTFKKDKAGNYYFDSINRK
ncbi:MAG: hypothetical protein KH135_01080 [Firmicutes bacterium]|nr:hypothetical protein [Bacillota bacterium]